MIFPAKPIVSTTRDDVKLIHPILITKHIMAETVINHSGGPDLLVQNPIYRPRIIPGIVPMSPNQYNSNWPYKYKTDIGRNTGTKAILVLSHFSLSPAGIVKSLAKFKGQSMIDQNNCAQPFVSSDSCFLKSYFNFIAMKIESAFLDISLSSSLND